MLMGHYGSLIRDKGWYTLAQQQLCFDSVRETMWKCVRSSCCLIAQRQQQALRNVSALVFKRCNSTAAVAQARPEVWDYAKPFEDIPGPKPLPVIGNAWRFIPYIGNVCCYVISLNVHQQSESMQQILLYQSAHICCHRKQKVTQ